MSPTQLTLRELRGLGWQHQVVEYWHAHASKRVDLFGVIDILACSPDGILGIQATTRDNMWNRRNKMLTKKASQVSGWITAGGLLEIWGWDKKDGAWRLKKETITLPTAG